MQAQHGVFMLRWGNPIPSGWPMVTCAIPKRAGHARLSARENFPFACLALAFQR